MFLWGATLIQADQTALHGEIGRRVAVFCKSAMMLVHKWMCLGLRSRAALFPGSSWWVIGEEGLPRHGSRGPSLNVFKSCRFGLVNKAIIGHFIASIFLSDRLFEG